MIFDERNFNVDEQKAIKLVIADTIEAMTTINDLNEHMKESIKELCDRLNASISVPEHKIKPSLISKLAKTKMKENIAEEKDKLSEVEVGLELLYGRN
jgi:lysyl-tRNA synthetase class II